MAASPPRSGSRPLSSRAPAFGFDVAIDAAELVSLGKALRRIGEKAKVDKAMIAGLAEGKRKLKTRSKKMLKGVTGIRVERRVAQALKQIPVRRSLDGEGWEAGLSAIDRHTSITTAWYGARWSRQMPGVAHHAWGRAQTAKGAFMIPALKPAFRRGPEWHMSRRGRYEQKLQGLWGPSMAREMERNTDRVEQLAQRIGKDHVVPTMLRLLRAAVTEAKQHHRL